MELAAGAAVTLRSVQVPQTGGPARACVTSGDLTGYVDRGAIGVLPLTAGSAGVVEGVGVQNS